MTSPSRVLIALLAGPVLAASLSLAKSARAQLPQRVITTEAASATSVFAADLDGDGAQDVLSASLADDKIAWYENEDEGFGAQQVITTAAEWAQDAYAADLDGDGDLDVLSASSYDNRVAWYENQIGTSGADSDGFGPQQTITTDADGAQDVYAADLDGDGDQDVLVAASTADKVVWYENQLGEAGSDRDGFGTEQVITTNATTVYSVVATDVDSDGDADVISASSFDDRVAWYENKIGEGEADGDGFGSQQVITESADGAVSVQATDLDGDGDPDVLSASSYDDRVAWYENQVGEKGGAGAFSAQRTITTDADYAASVFAADLDNDGDADVLSASRSDNRVAWYENQVGESGADSEGFGPQKTITTDADEAQSVYAADVSGNGAIDVLSASSNDDKIAWYANTDGSLPVELATFRGQQTGRGTVLLRWQTALEVRNAQFEVQRKTEARSETDAWTTIGRVEGRGTTATPHTYQYADSHPPSAADTLSYRLRQVDVDGTVHVSDAISVVREVKRVRLGPAYPSPARSRATVRIATPEPTDVMLHLYDVLGRRIRTIAVPGVNGRREVRLDVSGLAEGNYFLHLRGDETSRSTRLTVMR